MAEAARLKGVSYHTVSRAVRRGKLPAQRLGRMALITSDDLREWRPMRERAPHKYRRREPNPNASPALLDLSSGERVDLANRLSTLYEITHGVAGGMPTVDFLGLVADRLAAAAGLRRLAIWGFAGDGQRAERLASFGPALSTIAGAAAVGDAKGLRQVMESGESAVFSDVAEAFGVSGDDLIDVKDLFVVPMRIGDRRIGFIVADNNGGSFNVGESQRRQVQALANIAALVVERARLVGETGSDGAGELTGSETVARGAEAVRA